jgi:hypothetical protein
LLLKRLRIHPKITHCHLQKNSPNHAKCHKFFNKKHLTLCVRAGAKQKSTVFWRMPFCGCNSFSVGFNKSCIVFYATCGRRRRFAAKLSLKSHLAENTKANQKPLWSLWKKKTVLIRVNPRNPWFNFFYLFSVVSVFSAVSF